VNIQEPVFGLNVDASPHVPALRNNSIGNKSRKGQQDGNTANSKFFGQLGRFELKSSGIFAPNYSPQNFEVDLASQGMAIIGPKSDDFFRCFFCRHKKLLNLENFFVGMIDKS
jgi:hypothetical protein